MQYEESEVFPVTYISLWDMTLVLLTPHVLDWEPKL